MGPRTPHMPPAYDKLYVGQRVKLLRKIYGMTLVDWATAIGDKCSPQKICNYEQGEDQLPLHFAAKICIITGVDFDYIYRGMLSGVPKTLVRKIRYFEADRQRERA